MTPQQIAELIVKTLADKKAKDIKLLNTDKITVLADYFVICTATSTTHVRTLNDEVDKVLGENGEPPLRREGYRGGGWTILDFGCVIVHVFLAGEREFYSLERLWADAPEVDISGLIMD